ncbi:hypothetical protein ACSBR1_040862 [Camellia fascicularis]
MPALSLSFIHAVKDVKGMGFCNWAKLTLEFLVHGVRKYRNKGHREATGCIFLLVLFYLDCVSPTSVTTPATTRSIPRLNDWGDAEIRETLRRLRGKGSFNTVKMEFNFIKEESHVDDEQMDTHHVHKGKTEYDEVCLTKIETDVRKLKELILGKTECNEFRNDLVFRTPSPTGVSKS